MNKPSGESKYQGKVLVQKLSKKMGVFCLAYLGLIALCGATLLPGDGVFDAYKDDSNNYRVKL